MGYRWINFEPNQRLLHETKSRSITSIVRQRQLWLYGHVAHYPEVNPACRVVSERDNLAWRRPRGAHKVCDWVKSMFPVGRYLVLEGGLH